MVQVLFNTHYHFDHTAVTNTLGKNRVRIVAHENVKKRLSTTFENPAMGRTMEALQPFGLPTETYTTSEKLTFGPEAIEYTHPPVAHTDGDTFMFLPASNVLQTGDLLWVGRYPVVDYTAGGVSREGWRLFWTSMDKVGDANTRIIPGHGHSKLWGKADMARIREMWLTINKRLEDHASRGRSIDEVIARSSDEGFRHDDWCYRSFRFSASGLRRRTRAAKTFR